MRTSERAVQQIRWDPRLAPARFTILVDVHRRLPKRVPLPEFVPGGDIPWHRVQAIELDGERVWDRATGVDVLDDVAASGRARPRVLVGADWRFRDPVRWDGASWAVGPGTDRPLPERVRLVCWNVLWDRFEPERLGSEVRWPLLIDALLADGPDLVALQEVDPAFHAVLAGDPRIRDGWWLSHAPGHADIGRYDVLWLGRTAVDQIAVWPLGPHKAVLAVAAGDVVLATVHLTSDHAPRAAGTRALQVDALARLVSGLPGPVVVCGDFNLQAEEPILPLQDAWLAVHGVPAPTFDPPCNPLAAIGSLSGRPTRIDRVLLRGLHAHDARRLGTAPHGDVWLSDHYGLAVELAVGPPPDVCVAEPSVRSALAWVPDDVDAVQAVREAHDPAFGRWPPHLNVLWGFVGEPDLDAAGPVLEACLADQAPFLTRLGVPVTLPHDRSASHGLGPDDPEPWLALHARLRRGFPRCGRPDPTLHLTVARTELAAPAPPVDPLVGEVGELVVLTRRGAGRFEVRGRAALGGPFRWEPEPVWAPGEPVDASDLEVPGAVRVGSRALGIAIDGADVDLVFPELDPDAVRQALEPHVDGLIPVTKAGLPGFHGWRGALRIDAVPGGSPEASALAHAAIEDVARIRAAVDGRWEAFVPLARAVKGWARAQALDDPAFGGLEGLALAVLCARTVREVEGPDPSILAAFFATWAARSWTRPVGLDGDPPGEGFAVLTPSAPVRNIAERVVLPRLEQALWDAWACLDAGGRVEDLWRPFPFHRRFRAALEIRVDDRVAAGIARGRARALVERVCGVPCPGRPFVLGLPDADPARLRDAEDWASPLPGVSVAPIDVERVGSPGR